MVDRVAMDYQKSFISKNKLREFIADNCYENTSGYEVINVQLIREKFNL